MRTGLIRHRGTMARYNEEDNVPPVSQIPNCRTAPKQLLELGGLGFQDFAVPVYVSTVQKLSQNPSLSHWTPTVPCEREFHSKLSDMEEVLNLNCISNVFVIIYFQILF